MILYYLKKELLKNGTWLRLTVHRQFFIQYPPLFPYVTWCEGALKKWLKFHCFGTIEKRIDSKDEDVIIFEGKIRGS